jgi:hypothetical protein
LSRDFPPSNKRRKIRCTPRWGYPLPCFLEVLILRDFKSFEPEVLILRGFKSLFPEVLILVGFKYMGMSEMWESEIFLEVLILEGLRDFHNTLIPRGLRSKTPEMGRPFERDRGAALCSRDMPPR